MKSEKSRKYSSMLMAVLIIFTALTVINITTINVQAAPPETWDTDPERIIQNETRYREDLTIYVVGGNLTIKNNGTLVLNNSVTLEILNPAPPNDHKYGIIIESGGKLIINSDGANTTVKSETGNEDRTYHFTNSGTIDFLGATVERVYGDPSAPDTTGGIRNLPGSVCNLTNCDILDADTHRIK